MRGQGKCLFCTSALEASPPSQLADVAAGLAAKAPKADVARALAAKVDADSVRRLVADKVRAQLLV